MIDWYSAKEFCDHMLTSCFVCAIFVFFRCAILYLPAIFIAYEIVICIIYICWIDDVVSLYLLLLKSCVLRVLIAFYSVLIKDSGRATSHFLRELMRVHKRQWSPMSAVIMVNLIPTTLFFIISNKTNILRMTSK